MATLELHDVSYKYPDSHEPVLRKIDLRIETGIHVAILGANGSGKSTLARIAAGLIAPAEGKVELNGAESSEGWNSVGLLFQNPDDQFIASNVESEIAWGLENLNIPSREMQERVRDTLEQFNLQDLARKSPEALSDGEKQLTAIAAVLVMNPLFLVLDEVTAFLDPYWRRRLRSMIDKMKKNAGLLWISTNAGEAVDADKVVILQNGELVHSGTPREILIPNILEAAGIEPLK